jgi:P-type Cu+ transporter
MGIRLDREPIGWGIFSAAMLLGSYGLILSLLGGSVGYAWSQFSLYWYWLLPLVAGFGLQISFYLQLKKMHAAVSGKTVAVSGAASTGAMLSCCTHYLMNILPFLGIAGLATFASVYQQEIFALGLLANLAGLFYVGRKLINHSCPTK